MNDIIGQLNLDALKSLLLFNQNAPLLFNTGLFLILFAVFIIIYQAIRRWRMVGLVFTILFSLYFYYKSSSIYCLILPGICVSDYTLGRLLGIAERQFWRRAIVMLNVVVNVGMLVYFKYFNLLYETFANITGTDFSPLDIILPAGISFFTFRSISYIVDIYRGQLQPATNFIEYTFFLTFFPPLLAGPVVRAKDLLPQIKTGGVITKETTAEGLFLIMCGLVKKVIIADYISGNFVDRIFENPGLYSGFENLLGSFGFSLQLYCDFSGYSDMAIGLALLLGYRFKDNFCSPFKSQSPTEFWRRWHISLSTWLRDYIYIPFGGNRHGRARQNINLLATMAIGGLWHGASWMYILWGIYHGVLLVIHKTLKSLFKTPTLVKGNPIAVMFNVLITFVLVVAGFVIFRSPSLENLGVMFTQIFTNFHAEIIPEFVDAYLMIVLTIFVGFFLHFTPHSWTVRLRSQYAVQPLIVQSVIFAIVLFLVIQSRQTDLVPFIYLQY